MVTNVAGRTASRPLFRLRVADAGASGLLSRPTSRGTGLGVAIVGLAAMALASVLVGYQGLSIADVHAAYFSYSGSDTDLVVRHLRVPRTLAGLAVGVALGASGVVIQGVTRNPLGGPGILGVNAGASLGAVLAISVLGTSALVGYVWFAFLGAALAVVVVYMVGSLGLGGASPVKLALAGAAVSALLGSVVSAITLTDRSSLDSYRFWMVGSLAGADMTALWQAVPLLSIGIGVSVMLLRSLNALALGDDLARSLGSRVWVTRAAGGVAVVLLAGTATAVAGPIGFVGVAVPHIARAIAGPDYRWVLAWTAVLAPLLLLGADIIGRIVARPGELEVGIVTALLGAPFFIYLVRNRRVAGL